MAASVAGAELVVLHPMPGKVAWRPDHYPPVWLKGDGFAHVLFDSMWNRKKVHTWVNSSRDTRDLGALVVLSSYAYLQNLEHSIGNRILSSTGARRLDHRLLL